MQHTSSTTSRAVACKVLVVDDERDSAETMAMLLGLNGFMANRAFDGPSALKQVAEWKPDVVLLDLSMPGMDGFEVATEIRKQSVKTLLVAVTGWAQKADRQKTEAAGFDAHLSKPADLANVIALLRQLCDRRDDTHILGRSA